MLTVEVHGVSNDGEPRTIGTIAWDGKRIVGTPANDAAIKMILEEPAAKFNEEGPDGTFLTAKDGEAFLKALYLNYNGTRLRVSKAEESAA